MGVAVAVGVGGAGFAALASGLGDAEALGGGDCFHYI